MKTCVSLAVLAACILLVGCASTVPTTGTYVTEDGWICDGTACYPPSTPPATATLGFE